MNPLQQTPLWQSFLSDLGETTFFKSGDNWHFLAILKRTPFGSYLYCPYGPVITAESALEPAYSALKSLALANNAIFIRIEPQSQHDLPFLRSHSKKSPTPTSTLTQPKTTPHQKSPAPIFPALKKVIDLNPADTLILDLIPEEGLIYGGFTSSNRNRYNTIAKKGMTITTSKNPDDIAHLVRLQSTVAKAKHFHTFSSNYLKTELKQPFTTLYLVHFAGQVIAASLFFDHAGTRYYMQSAADPKANKLAPTVALLSTAIFDAKAAGLNAFDFWGIAPANAPKNHPWHGFTTFKKSFGGTPVAYCGTHDLVLRPLRYHTYQFFRKLNRFARKLLP